MDAVTFNLNVNELLEHSYTTLVRKNAGYTAGDEDRLHAFKRGASAMGCTPMQCAMAYMTKHLISMQDMAKCGVSDMETLREKCGDALNYCVLFFCLGAEELEEHARAAEEYVREDSGVAKRDDVEAACELLYNTALKRTREDGDTLTDAQRELLDALMKCAKEQEGTDENS